MGKILATVLDFSLRNRRTKYTERPFASSQVGQQGFHSFSGSSWVLQLGDQSTRSSCLFLFVCFCLVGWLGWFCFVFSADYCFMSPGCVAFSCLWFCSALTYPARLYPWEVFCLFAGVLVWFVFCYLSTSNTCTYPSF